MISLAAFTHTLAYITLTYKHTNKCRDNIFSKCLWCYLNNSDFTNVYLICICWQETSTHAHISTTNTYIHKRRMYECVCRQGIPTTERCLRSLQLHLHSRAFRLFMFFLIFMVVFYLFFISPLILFICIGACSADNVVITSFCNVIERKRTLAAVGAVELLIDGRIRRWWQHFRMHPYKHTLWLVWMWCEAAVMSMPWAFQVL